MRISDRTWTLALSMCAVLVAADLITSVARPLVHPPPKAGLTISVAKTPLNSSPGIVLGPVLLVSTPPAPADCPLCFKRADAVHQDNVLAQSPEGSQMILRDGTLVGWNGALLGEISFASYMANPPVTFAGNGPVLGGNTTTPALKWADDGDHLCAILDSNALPLGAAHGGYLWTFAPNERANRVGPVGGSARTILSCSWLNQAAVVEQAQGGMGIAPPKYGYIDLRTGQETDISISNLPGQSQFSSAFVSRDAKWLGVTTVDNPSPTAKCIPQRTAYSSYLLRMTDGTLMRTFPDAAIFGFSYSGYVIGLFDWVNIAPFADAPFSCPVDSSLVLTNWPKNETVNETAIDLRPTSTLRLYTYGGGVFPNSGMSGFITEIGQATCGIGEMPLCWPGTWGDTTDWNPQVEHTPEAPPTPPGDVAEMPRYITPCAEPRCTTLNSHDSQLTFSGGLVGSLLNPSVTCLAPNNHQSSAGGGMMSVTGTLNGMPVIMWIGGQNGGEFAPAYDVGTQPIAGGHRWDHYVDKQGASGITVADFLQGATLDVQLTATAYTSMPPPDPIQLVGQISCR